MDTLEIDPIVVVVTLIALYILGYFFCQVLRKLFKLLFNQERNRKEVIQDA